MNTTVKLYEKTNLLFPEMFEYVSRIAFIAAKTIVLFVLSAVKIFSFGII